MKESARRYLFACIIYAYKDELRPCLESISTNEPRELTTLSSYGTVPVG